VTPSPRERALTWTFVAPTLARPTGGDLAMFEVANAIARRGRDLVQIAHVPWRGSGIRTLSEVPWFDFDGAVEHRFRSDLDPDGLPDADALVFSTKLLASALSTEAEPTGPRLVRSLQRPLHRGCLAILFLQGHGVFGPEVEELACRLPGPKVCVGSWLASLLVEQGVPRGDVVHIPNGVDPQQFRVLRSIEGRPAQVSMNFDPHPVKGGSAGIAALEQLHRRQSVPATVFGTRPPDRPLSAGLTFVPSPTRASIVDIYNASSLFLQPSEREGFGMCAVEAMASGCALVTTANGGSADYAFDGETALVCDAGPDAMQDALSRLVRDDPLRIALATAGARYVERFRWAATAERFVGLAESLLTIDP